MIAKTFFIFVDKMLRSNERRNMKYGIRNMEYRIFKAMVFITEIIFLKTKKAELAHPAMCGGALARTYCAFEIDLSPRPPWRTGIRGDGKQREEDAPPFRHLEPRPHAGGVRGLFQKEAAVKTKRMQAGA
jgi:hypothetical protein